MPDTLPCPFRQNTHPEDNPIIRNAMALSYAHLVLCTAVCIESLIRVMKYVACQLYLA